MCNTYSIESIEVDSLIDLIKMAYAFENWEKVLTLSSSLLDFAMQVKNDRLGVRTKRHLVYYFGYGHLMKGLAYQKLKQYSKSVECILLYADLSWLEDSSQESVTTIADFKLYAEANMLTVQILMGNKNKVHDYVEFLQSNPEQILSGIITLLESAILYSYNIDKQIDLLTPHIKDSSFYVEQVVASKYLSYKFLLAVYQYLNYSYASAIVNTLHNLIDSDKVKNDNFFKKSVTFFEVLRTKASESQLEQYSCILKRIFKGEIVNEENFIIGGRFTAYRFH